MASFEIPNHHWVFAATKYLNDLDFADDELLLAMDSISNAVLTSEHDDNLSTEVDLLSTQ